MNGRGHLIKPDETEIIGMFKKDKICGPGILTWPDGKKYQGNWHDSKMHGSGLFISAKGTLT
jgi:hypothetical protein